jgi:trehalose 6-phosphate phosphatase
MIWEIRPPLDINKGVAARALIELHGLRSAIFLGDDRTDADVFSVLRELRAENAAADPPLATLGVGVAGPETPAVVRERADLLVEGVPGVERLLAEIATIVTQAAD